MPSGKRSKRQRREAAAPGAPPPVRSKGVGARPRQASPRALAIGGGVLALVVIGVVLFLVLGNGGGSSGGIPAGTPTIGAVDANALPGAAEIRDLYKGIPQHGLTLGSDTAPVEMTMFIDLQCPICQNFEVTSLPTIVSKYVRTGKVRLDVEPWAFIGNDSFRGRLAMIAASFQNKAFEFAGVLYDNQGTENTGWLTDSMIAQIASSVGGLNVSDLFAARNEAKATSVAKSVDALATADNVQGTPTVLVGKAGSKLKDVTTPGNAPSLAEVTTAIDTALAG